MTWPRRCGRIETEFLPGGGVASQFAELRVQGRRSKLHSDWCKMSFPREPSGWVLFRPSASTSPLGGGVHRLVPPTHSHWSPAALTLLLQTCKMYFCLKLHLYICLFFISKACFLDKFINILAGALSPCKSLSPTHMPTLPARLHPCFSTCSSRVETLWPCVCLALSC